MSSITAPTDPQRSSTELDLPGSLAEHARAIHELAKRTREDIIAIGRHLAEARDHVGHGAWADWIAVEFGWSDQTAYRFIHVYELNRDAKFHTLVELDLPLGVLYQLAAPKAVAARQEIAERIEAGEPISQETVIEAIKGHRHESDPAAESGRRACSSPEIGKIENDDASASAETRKAAYPATEAAGGAVEHDLGGADDAELARPDDHGEYGSGADDDGDGAAHGASGNTPEVSSSNGGAADGAAEVADGANVGNGDGDGGADVASAPAPAPAPRKLPAKKKPALRWEEATPEEAQIVRGLILEEFFARASGTEMHGNIPVSRRVEMVRDLLDHIGVEGMLTAMSPEFGQQLRARMPAPKNGKPGKSFNKTRVRATAGAASQNSC